MTDAEITRAKEIVRDIQQDMANDAINFDGKPFTGRTVAEYFGNQGAAIAAVARVVEKMLDVVEREKAGAR